MTWEPWQVEKLVAMKEAHRSSKEIQAAIGKSVNQINVKWCLMRKADGNRRKSSRWTNRTFDQAVPTAPSTTYTDEQGRVITVCPPGYAIGAYPQRSVKGKGQQE